MRLIDADLFVNNVKSGLYVYLQANSQDVIDAINDEPTLLRSSPIGEWLHPYSTDIACECSICHRQMPITDYYYFCPNCGAYMRGNDNG